MRLPPLFRTTPFRLTLLFLALFAVGAAAFLAFIYIATAGESVRRADREIGREMAALESVYRRDGAQGLNRALIERSVEEGPFVYLLQAADGSVVSGTLSESPVEQMSGAEQRIDFEMQAISASGAPEMHSARGLQRRMARGEMLFVGVDTSEGERYVARISRALYGSGALILALGLVGGVIVSRNVSGKINALNRTVTAVQAGDLYVRAPVRGAGDEYDELALGLNGMLDRIERLMGGLRHAGDAIAHDLRSPLTRFRARLELGLIEAENGKGDPKATLEQALEDADHLLRTFNAVLAISRLQAVGEPPDPVVFDVGELGGDVCELYEPVCEEKGLDFSTEFERRLDIRGNREFVAQAMANLVDNAVKYTPEGGAVMLRTRRRSSGEVEFSVTDTGPGVPDEQRARIVERFVRLENSRSQPGTGLGLSLVAAVAQAHKARLEIDEGPGEVGGFGPGLRTALVFPRA